MLRITFIALLILLAIPCLPNAETKEVTKEANRFAALDNGVVKDSKTGLEWIVGPDKNTSWFDAKKWVDSINKNEVAGGGWRMPTREELKSLYKKKAGKRNMTPLLKTTGWWIWSGDTEGTSSAWGFHFHSGQESRSSRDRFLHSLRAFAVRSPK